MCITFYIPQKVEKSKIGELITAYAKFKSNQALGKISSGKKTRIIGIPKLDDANQAGRSQSEKCTLILTEGDSAKSFVISGLSVIGREYYGVFPLRGKMLNVRDASNKQIMANEEIKNIITIMGLKMGGKYTKGNLHELRYGRLMIAADQDTGGTHIFSLVALNLFNAFWPSLLEIPGFISRFITPIVIARTGTEMIPFFTLPEFEKWKEKTMGVRDIIHDI
jgi:DNA topoisomerase-2